MNPLRNCTIFTVLSAITASGGMAQLQTVTRLSAAADTIVTGSKTGTMVSGALNATVLVERVLKGKILSGASLTISWTAPPGPASLGTGTISGHGIFFLRQTSNGSYSIVPAVVPGSYWEHIYIKTPAASPQGIRDVVLASLPKNPSTLDNVLSEIIIVVESGTIIPNEWIDAVRGDASPVVSAAFTRFLASQDSRLRTYGLRGLIINGDAEAILAVYQNYSNLSSSLGWRNLVDEIKYRYVNPDPQSVRNLGSIALDVKAPLDLRMAGAFALSRIHTATTLPYLAQLLDDQTDVMIRVAACGGLGMFANNVPIGEHSPAPGPWPYRTPETIARSGHSEASVRNTDLVSFWKNWWQQNRSKLQQ